jgi:hypothetical protein
VYYYVHIAWYIVDSAYEVCLTAHKLPQFCCAAPSADSISLEGWLSQCRTFGKTFSMV